MTPKRRIRRPSGHARGRSDPRRPRAAEAGTLYFGLFNVSGDGNDDDCSPGWLGYICRTDVGKYDAHTDSRVPGGEMSEIRVGSGVVYSRNGSGDEKECDGFD